MGVTMFYLFFIAAALSIDALILGFTYGIRKIKIPFISKGLIFMISFVCCFISSAVGKNIITIFPDNAGKILSIIMLFGLGVYMTASNFIEKEINNNRKKYHIASKVFGITITIIKDPVSGDQNNSLKIECLEAVYIGIALSLDSVGIGFGSGFFEKSIYLFPTLVGGFQTLMVCIGAIIGKSFSAFNLNKKFLSLVPGIILIILSVIKSFELFV